MCVFFEYNKIRKKFKNKFKIITALSVFYDLKNPNKFLKDLSNLITNDGIILIEFADLQSIIKKKMFDTFCHEHLEYYSTTVINMMLNKNNLKLIDVKENEINGSSKQFFIAKKNSIFKTNLKKIKHFLELEKKEKLNTVQTFYKLKKEIVFLKRKLLDKINMILKNKQIIHGYGASTKGNVLLQFFGIDNKKIKFISDRNPKKNNLYTISSIDEKPSVAKAKSNLAVVGRFILTPNIFKLLSKTKPGHGNEIQLTDAIHALLSLDDVYGYQFSGKRYDCGSKIGYLKATVNYALKHEDLSSDFKKYIKIINTPKS